LRFSRKARGPSLASGISTFRQNNGTLSKKRRANEYKKLSDHELDMLESIVRDAFEGFDDHLHD